ncbi:MAG: hypothetical protein AB9882_09300 [Ignavibacteriaceae bacterium]
MHNEKGKIGKKRGRGEEDIWKGKNGGKNQLVKFEKRRWRNNTKNATFIFKNQVPPDRLALF